MFFPVSVSVCYKNMIFSEYNTKCTFKLGVVFAPPAASVTITVWIPDRPDLKKLRCCSTFFSPPDSVRPERWAVCAEPVCHIPTHTHTTSLASGWKYKTLVLWAAVCFSPCSYILIWPPESRVRRTRRVKIELLLTHQYWPVCLSVFLMLHSHGR